MFENIIKFFKNLRKNRQEKQQFKRHSKRKITFSFNAR